MMLILVCLVIGKVCVSRLIHEFIIRLKRDYFKPSLILGNREVGMNKT